MILSLFNDKFSVRIDQTIENTYLPTNKPTYLPTNHPTYQPIYLPTNLTINVPTNQPTKQPAHQPNLAQLAGVVKYTDCISEVGYDPHPKI